MEIVTKQEQAERAETTTDKSDLCFNLVKELKEKISSVTQNYMRIGDILELAFVSKIYRHYDSVTRDKNQDDRKTWAYFVSQTCPFGVSMADHIRRVSREFKGAIGDREVPFNRLLEMLPVVNDTNRTELLDKAADKTTTFESFRNDIRKIKGQVTTDGCAHENREPWERCTDCFKFLKL